ncbi:BTB/POZ domain-containing protein [Melia azedarach]|uniref:BTB/POZ domain-containing protein n=1 Tax=Melia azedarach TaxID=155640 RepID=A0ACC1YA99_MELAZ|nr:BTB/POZ domain-containing protein [Melia azedarach]
MDCSICSSMPFILRPPRNTICGACYEGARSIITLMNKLEGDKGADNNNSNNNNKPNNSLLSPPNSCKPLSNVPKWVNGMKDLEDELNKKIAFLSGFAAAFREQIHTDIQIMPGNNGSPVPAHKALLAARSEIFKNMLDSDGCKAPPSGIITLPELNHEELESLLDFLYSGSLPSEKLEKHVYSLFLAADKYGIAYLQEYCERHMLSSLNSSNALDVLEISDVCSNRTLKETALNFIVKNMEEVTFSSRYEVFAPKNPHLCVQITRAFLMDTKSRRNTAV